MADRRHIQHENVLGEGYLLTVQWGLECLGNRTRSDKGTWRRRPRTRKWHGSNFKRPLPISPGAFILGW